MRRTGVMRVGALLLVASVVAAACSKPKEVARAPKSATESETFVPVAPTAPPTTAVVAAPAAAARTRAATRRAAPGTRLTGGGDDAQARAIGALIKPQSTVKKKPYYSGITDDTITVDFGIDPPPGCGVNATNAVVAAGAAIPTATRFYRDSPKDPATADSEIRESIDLMIKYWNDHAFDAAAYAPAIRNLMGNDATHQFYGRKLRHNIIDSGSNQCPDKQRAAAQRAANDDHAFAVFNNLDGLSPTGAYNMSAQLNTIGAGNSACSQGLAGCPRPMNFGTLWLSDQYYTKFAPYTWTQFSTGSTIMRQYASYVCSKLVGGKAVRSPDPVIQAQTRSFGFVHTNLEQDVLLANEFKGYLDTYCAGKGGRGIIKHEVTYDGTDFSSAQRDDANVILQLKDVTTVLMMADIIQPLFQLQQAQAQSFSPEWVWSSISFGDSSTIQRAYDDNQVRGSFGTSNLGVYGGFGFGSGDPFAMYHTYHLTAPDGKPCDSTSEEGMSHGDSDKSNGTNAHFCKAPTPLVTWYYTFLPFIGGSLFAGPDLTPHNVSVGLQAFPTTRYGGNGPTSDPRPALVGAGAGRYGFVVDSVEWRWRTDFTSPTPEAKPQWVEYPDCMRHYLLWPDQYAPNWEPNGANWTKWCSKPDGYPIVPPEETK